MSIINDLSLEDYFNIRVKNLNCRKDTAAYIKNTLQNYKSSTYDFTNKSLTLEFAKAKFETSFNKMNELADYILFMETTFPAALSIKGADRKYYFALGQMAYYKCFILINRSWILFEELADLLPNIIEQLNITYNQDT